MSFNVCFRFFVIQINFSKKSLSEIPSELSNSLDPDLSDMIWVLAVLRVYQQTTEITK